MAAIKGLYSVISIGVLVFSFISLLNLSFMTEAGNGGFSIDLIHRDSMISPFYNPSDTPNDRLRNAFRRSITRINHFKPASVSPNTLQSTVIANSGEYLMKVSIGTPPVEVLGIADTGSDLIWTQCKPCTGCYNQVLPLFDPKQSSTYRNVACDSKPCIYLRTGTCTSQNVCQYGYGYGDKSYTKGFLATETFTMDSTSRKSIAIPKIVFGCGHNNTGTFDKKGSGLIGLGGGQVSLIAQLGSSIGGKFSYCLVPLNSDASHTSKLNFGSSAVVSGAGVVSTPLAPKAPETFYYLTLEGFSVGEKRLGYKDSSSKASMNEGNIIIDSGTTLTMIPSDMYTELESAVKEAITLEPVADQEEGILTLCYNSETDIDVPIITAHFTGADVKLTALNTFIRSKDEVTRSEAVGMEISPGEEPEMNFLVGYDLQEKKVSFKPTDCTKN
ncbi:hypothetical protein HHK36_028316 [Tetracentron sinense]|uniref:Peptidase A1 domain-containing protein n=1 Tax=Tetracentron sinense TaxID=13715 RepID=A0A834YIZ2_TETSI|nr:hypothetical protein HHK36_028316 [Tetracentron sinense]